MASVEVHSIISLLKPVSTTKYNSGCCFQNKLSRLLFNIVITCFRFFSTKCEKLNLLLLFLRKSINQLDVFPIIACCQVYCTNTASTSQNIIAYELRCPNITVSEFFVHAQHEFKILGVANHCYPIFFLCCKPMLKL